MEPFNPLLLEKSLTILINSSPYDGINPTFVRVFGQTGSHHFYTDYTYYNLPEDMACTKSLVAFLAFLEPYLHETELTIKIANPSLKWLLCGDRSPRHTGEKWAMQNLRKIGRIICKKRCKIKVELSADALTIGLRESSLPKEVALELEKCWKTQK